MGAATCTPKRAICPNRRTTPPTAGAISVNVPSGISVKLRANASSSKWWPSSDKNITVANRYWKLPTGETEVRKVGSTHPPMPMPIWRSTISAAYCTARKMIAGTNPSARPTIPSRMMSRTKGSTSAGGEAVCGEASGASAKEIPTAVSTRTCTGRWWLENTGAVTKIPLTRTSTNSHTTTLTAM